MLMELLSLERLMLDAVDPKLLPLLAEKLRALGDPQRLRLMRALSDGPRTVGELVDLVGTTQPNVSRHLARLEQTGWVTRERDGNRVLVRLSDEVSGDLCDLLCALVRRQAARAAVTAGLGREGGNE